MRLCMADPYIDMKYIRLLASSLRNYKEKKRNLINFSCPLCGDSTSDKKKARGYIYEKQNKFQYKCHKCGVGCSAGNLIKAVNEDLYKEYKAEKFKTKYKATKPKPRFKNKLFETKVKPFELGMMSLDGVESGKVLDYVKGRMIPESEYHRIYYTSDINEVAKRLGYDTDFPVADMVVFKFVNDEGNTTHIQGRYIEAQSKKFRFVTLDVMKDQPKIFGQDSINPDEKVYIVEAPIDSLFLPNAIAYAGSSLNTFTPKYKDYTIVLDREPKNEAIVKIMNKCIEKGFPIAILPNNLVGKDINDYIKNGMDSIPLKELIDVNTFKGMKAKLRMTMWKQGK